MISNLSKILNDLNTFVVPDLCFGCNAVLYRGEQPLCAFCRHELPLTEYNYSEINAADRLFYGCVEVEKTNTMFFYREGGIVQALIHALKYRGQQQIGAYLGTWFGLQLEREGCLKNIDLVLPVPLHPTKKKKRGYNQCSHFGRGLAEGLGTSYSEDYLYKTQPTPTQTKNNRWVRWQSTSRVFRLREAEQLNDKNILLVDDVITTGATLEACCRAFSPLKNTRIYIAAMAIVP